MTIKSQLIGDYNFGNIAIAIAIGQYFKINEVSIKQAIESYQPSNNRSQIIKKEGVQLLILAPSRELAIQIEQVAKAMGTGFRHGIWVRDVGITNNDWGRPLIIWSERGQKVCERLGIGSGHVSLTDDAGLIIAFAVVETVDQQL